MQKYDLALKNAPKESDAVSFMKFIADSSNHKNQISEIIKNCRVDEQQVRFNIWRMTLLIIGMDSSIEAKVEELQQSRQDYIKKKQQAWSGVVQQKQVKVPKNPLMKEMMKSPKIQKTSNQILKEDIKKDVDRTYQEIPFFQDQNILKLLTSILFTWCKINSQISYIQGMNEVLASIVYVYFQGAYSPNREPNNFQSLAQKEKQIFIFFNSIQFCESDIYSVFEKIMNIQQDMYRTQTDSSLKGIINPNSKNNTPILQRIINLIDHKLKSLDIQLFRIIKLQDVQIKSFLLRWIRCMHTRQFSLENSFIIWDSLFLDYHESSKQKNMFEFIDVMCLAMFIYLRSLALTRQTAYQIQQIYQKYPSLKKGGYLEQLISLAWSLADALKNPNQNNADWVGQESSKVNTKLQVMKGKDNRSHKEQQFKQQLQKKTNGMLQKKKSDNQKPKSTQQNLVMGQVVNSSENNSKVQTFSNGPQLSQKKVDSFSITLESQQWKALQESIKSSLNFISNPQARQKLENSLLLIQKKIAAKKIG